MKKYRLFRSKKHFSILITIFFILIFIYYFYNHLEEFRQLLEIDTSSLILVGLLQLTTILVNGVFLRVILLPFSTDPSISEGFMVSLLSTIGNYFTPFRGGAGIRAVYLKTKYNFPYSDFLATLYGNYVIVFLFFAIVGITSTLLLWISSGQLFSILIMIFTTILIITILFITLPVSTYDHFFKRLPQGNNLLSYTGRFLEGWKIISQDHILMIKLLGITCLNFIIFLTMTKMVFKVLNIEIDLLSTIMYAVISNLSLFISLTPASLGIRESLLIIFSGAVGLTNSQILQAAIITRGSMFMVLAISSVIIGFQKLISCRKAYTDKKSNNKPN